MENVSLIVAGLPARGDAGDHFPVGVLIDQPFEQIARQLGLRQANRFDRIERGRFVFNVAHDFLFGRQRGAREPAPPWRCSYRRRSPPRKAPNENLVAFFFPSL